MAAVYGGVGGSGQEEDGECMTRQASRESFESQRYFLTRRTVLEMLQDRGYEVPDTALNISLNEFLYVYGNKPNPNQLRICAPLRSNPIKKVLVLFLVSEQVRTKDIREVFGQIMNRESLHKLILIVQSKITSYAKKELEKLSLKVELFHVSDLLVNITKHMLSPRYEILNAAEKHNLLKKYDVEEKQLPSMLETDAFARYYGLEKGQVVKVIYNGGIADSLETYRCII